ncbi:MAG: MFS transporter [Xanthobacteraceae bacterium]|jgi:MFS transporter, YNFM family, putative membrane transport protein
MAFDVRALAIATAGFSAFVNLYSPQSLLPELAREFGVGAGDISTLMTATTAAIALTAPFTGALADVFGRKRLITAAGFAVVVPTLLMMFADSVTQLAILRFVQGLLLPPIFTVAVAYVGDEWPPAEVPRVAGLFISGSSVGGFSGRFVTGAVADLFGWRASFLAVALLTLIGALIVTLALPRERGFVRSGGLLASAHQMLAHLRNPRLLAIYAVGFGVLFNFIATFTYVSFHLAAAPYFFTPTMLGALFATYLSGSFIVPWVGRAILMFGRRRFILGVIAVWICGSLMLLAPPVWAIIVGLTICATCGMLCQAVSTGYVITTAKEGRSSAAGLYASSFYIGGSAGAFLMGLVWHAAGWDGCVAAIIAIQAAMAVIVALAWERSRI